MPYTSFISRYIIDTYDKRLIPPLRYYEADIFTLIELLLI